MDEFLAAPFVYECVLLKPKLFSYSYITLDKVCNLQGIYTSPYNH